MKRMYMLIFNAGYNNQYVATFDNDSMKVTQINAFKDTTKSGNKKVKKMTLAEIDAITNKFKSMDQMFSVLCPGEDSSRFYSRTSFIGYLHNKYMNRITISYNDPVLAEIALNAKGNEVNLDHDKTREIMIKIDNLICDDNSSFFKELVEEYRNGLEEKKRRYNHDTEFNFPTMLIDHITNYRKMKKVISDKYAQGRFVSEYDRDDLIVFTEAYKSDLKSYKYFRELYRFYVKYQKKHALDAITQTSFERNNNEVNIPKQKVKKKNEVSDDQLRLF